MFPNLIPLFHNRYGFNSEGHEVIYSRVKLENDKEKRAIIGVNLGKNKLSPVAAEDYVAGVKKFGQVADYLVINVSSPNTPGLRGLQQKAELENLISLVVEARNSLNLTKLPPLLLKIAPDLSQEEKKDIANVVLQDKVCCLFCCDTFIPVWYNLTLSCSVALMGLSFVTPPSVGRQTWRANAKMKLVAWVASL